jgi:hypothetical protein
VFSHLMCTAEAMGVPLFSRVAITVNLVMGWGRGERGRDERGCPLEQASAALRRRRRSQYGVDRAGYGRR